MRSPLQDSSFIVSKGEGAEKAARTGEFLVALFLIQAVSLAGCGGRRGAVQHFIAPKELEVQGRVSEAIAEYDGAIRLNPTYAKAFRNRALTYTPLWGWTGRRNEMSTEPLSRRKPLTA